MNNRFLYFIIFMLCAYSITYAQSAKSDSLFEIGLMYYQKGKYKEALPYFQELLAIDSILYRETNSRYRIYIYK